MGHMAGLANDLALPLVSEFAACGAYCINGGFYLNIYRVIALLRAAERLFVALKAKRRIGIISPKKRGYKSSVTGRLSVRSVACGALKQAVFVKREVSRYAYFVRRFDADPVAGVIANPVARITDGAVMAGKAHLRAADNILFLLNLSKWRASMFDKKRADPTKMANGALLGRVRLSAEFKSSYCGGLPHKASSEKHNTINEHEQPPQFY